MSRHALFATASLHGVPVDETSVPQGTPFRAGREGEIPLPVPEGAPFVAEARWTGPGRVEVVDGAGGVHQLGPGDDLVVALGPVQLELSLVVQYALTKTDPFASAGSLAWFVSVLAMSVLTGQMAVVWSNRCDWFAPPWPALLRPECVYGEPVAMGGLDQDFLVRLLEGDVEGDDEGNAHEDDRGGKRTDMFVPRERPLMPDGRELDSHYLAAGDVQGPRDQAEGGARETAPTPVRTPSNTPKPPPVEKEPQEAVVPAVADVGTEVEGATRVEEADDAVAAQDDIGIADTDAPADDEVTPPPAEEELGFGMQDWLDMTPEERDVALAIVYAKRRLRLDPDDEGALSLLAYHQYLAEDLEGAEKTYDHLIEIDPENGAAYNNKALIYKRRKAYAEEEALYRVALAIDPEDETAMNNLAVNLSHQGRYDEALATMERLEKLLPGDPYSDLHRAKIHADMGNTAEALRYFDRALAGMKALDTLHHIEFRQDIRVDPSFSKLREDPRFRAILTTYYGDDSPLQD